VWEDNVHIVWLEDSFPMYRHLWYSNSYDGGDTWNTPVYLSQNPNTRASDPKVAVNGSNIHVIWVEYFDKKVHYMNSTDNGLNWSTERALTPRLKLGTDFWDIAVFESNIHIIYLNINRTLSYIRSTDNGMIWNPPKILSTTTRSLIYASIAVNDSFVHVVWDDAHYTSSELYYVKSEDNGSTWGDIVNITSSPTITNRYFDIDVYNESIYVVYGTEEGARVPYFSYSEDNGDTWNRNIKLENSSHDLSFPVIEANNNHLFVAWHQYTGTYYKYSPDGGKTWSNAIELTKDGQAVGIVDIDSYNNIFHIVWVDRRDGNWEIYYKRCSFFESSINATIDIDPDTFNLKSKGKWVTAYIELEEGYNLKDINISTVTIENTIHVESRPTKIGDYDNDGIPDLMVKFDRAELEDILMIGDSVSLSIKGNFINGYVFEDNDIIRVIEPP
jgi:hypothetical protein